MATRNQIATRFGVDPSTVSRWVAAGCPATGPDFDEAAVTDWLSRNPGRKPAGRVIRNHKAEDQLYQLLDERLAVAGALGIADNDRDLLMHDIAEFQQVAIEEGAGGDFLEFAHGVIGILTAGVVQFEQVVIGKKKERNR